MIMKSKSSIWSLSIHTASQADNLSFIHMELLIFQTGNQIQKSQLAYFFKNLHFYSVVYDQCVNRDTQQQFQRGSQEATSKQTSDFSPSYFATYFSHVCPFQVQVLDMSSIFHMGKLKWLLGNTSRGRHCAGVSPALPHQSQGDLNSKPGILWHYPQTMTREPQLDSGASCPPCPGKDQQVQLPPASAQQGSSLQHKN